ncbi:MAG: PDZ domain-containing protein [Acidobacteria bacterium]|nr:PDZ domain-containing protein [Acidobacteriota bacterium]
MKKQIIKAILATAILSVTAFAQDGKPFFRIIEGKWKGTLEYQDYTSGKRVKMSTIITIKASADGNSAETFTIYDDFGKIYKADGRERIDLAGQKYFDGDTEFSIESNEAGKIVLVGKTKDGNTVEPTRKTISYTNDSLTILKETRSPWQFRNSYTLNRIVEDRESAVVLSPKQLSDDFAILKRTLTSIHPGIYRYQTPESLELEFAAFESKLGAPMPESEFLVLVSQFVGKLRCGHTYVNFYNQDAKLKARLFGGRTYLPFYFRIVDGRFIITANASSKNIAVGSEILKINGVAVKEIIAKLLTVTKGDGKSTLGHRIDSIGLSRNEAESYALFDWYFPLFFPIKDEIYDIEAKSFASKQNANFSILAMTKEERTAEMAKRYGPTPTYDDGWKFEIRDGATAYLKIDNSITWRLKTIKFKEFLAAAFAELRAKKIPNLIIDVRGNGGGSMDIGFELARYLAPRVLGPYAESRRLVRNVAARPELAKYLDTYSDELKFAIQNGIPALMYRKFDENYSEIVGRESYPAVEPYADRFDGKAFIIADASNASATFQFLDYVKRNRLATIVGQPTGGNRQGINGGNYFFLRLPNSKVEVDIPVYFQAPLTTQPDESVIPDIIVQRSADDIGNRLDREFSAILAIVSKDAR